MPAIVNQEVVWAWLAGTVEKAMTVVGQMTNPLAKAGGEAFLEAGGKGDRALGEDRRERARWFGN